MLNALLLLKRHDTKRQILNMKNTIDQRCEDKHRFPVMVNLNNTPIERLAQSINDVFHSREALQIQLKSVRSDLKTQMASLAHDLRTPLTAIKGYAQLLSDGTLDQGTETAFKKAMLQRIEDLDRMTIQFYELIRLEQQVDVFIIGQFFKKTTFRLKDSHPAALRCHCADYFFEREAVRKQLWPDTVFCSIVCGDFLDCLAFFDYGFDCLLVIISTNAFFDFPFGNRVQVYVFHHLGNLHRADSMGFFLVVFILKLLY